MSNQEFDDLRRQFAAVLRHSASSLRSSAIAVEQYANIIESGGIPSSHDIRQISTQLPQLPMLMGLGMGMGYPSGQDGPSGKAEGKKKKGAAGDHMVTDTISPIGDDGETKKRKRGPRKPKDPNAPKRPPSAYLIFQNEVRRGIKEKNPEMTNNEVLAEVAKLWGELTMEEKKPYNDATELAKIEYEKAKAEYEAAHPPLAAGGVVAAPATGDADHDTEDSEDDAAKMISLPVDHPSKVKVVSKESASKEKDKKKKEKEDKKKEVKKEPPKKDKARPSTVSTLSKPKVESDNDSDEESDVIFNKRLSTASKKKAETPDSDDDSISEEESEDDEPPKKRMKGGREEVPVVSSSKKDKAKKK